MEVVHCTPTEEELLPEREIQCEYDGCKSVFTNAGNLDMHLQRHHGKQPLKRSDEKQCVFHCPKIQCTYHELHPGKMQFKTLKYLRQHYKKVHANKINICDRCGKAFISVNQLKTHMEKLCGIKYTCLECGWEYSSKEALLTHGKRKGHKVRDIGLVEIKTKHRQNTQTQHAASQSNDRETQTEGKSQIQTLIGFIVIFLFPQQFCLFQNVLQRMTNRQKQNITIHMANMCQRIHIRQLI